jgi:CRP/FNR family transcriptional regulator, cyclic AMP receptor protein
MSPILDPALTMARLSSLPVEIHPPGGLVLATGSTTGKLLILKQGAVEVVRDGMRLAEVSEPGAVFGELALLLGRPHTADVRALERSTFHVADGRTFLRVDPTAALYVAVILAGRLDLVNSYLIEARSQLKPAERGSVLEQMIDNIAEALRFGPPL